MLLFDLLLFVYTDHWATELLESTLALVHLSPIHLSPIHHLSHLSSVHHSIHLSTLNLSTVNLSPIHLHPIHPPPIHLPPVHLAIHWIGTLTVKVLAPLAILAGLLCNLLILGRELEFALLLGLWRLLLAGPLLVLLPREGLLGLLRLLGSDLLGSSFLCLALWMLRFFDNLVLALGQALPALDKAIDSSIHNTFLIAIEPISN